MTTENHNASSPQDDAGNQQNLKKAMQNQNELTQPRNETQGSNETEKQPITVLD
jgi:hypothetical protein